MIYFKRLVKLQKASKDRIFSLLCGNICARRDLYLISSFSSIEVFQIVGRVFLRIWAILSVSFMFKSTSDKC